MRIIVCEREDTKISALREQLTHASVFLNVELEVFWLSGEGMEEKLSRYLPGTHLVMLSMELSGGAALAKFVHECNPHCHLLIYGGKIETLPEWIPGGPLSFCPQTQTVLPELQRLLLEITESQTVFSYQFRRESRYVPYNDILYFQSNLRKVELICRSGDEHGFLDKLDFVEQRVKGPAFVRIHKSYLVNVQYISKLDHAAREIELRNGARLPVSGNYYKQVMERLGK